MSIKRNHQIALVFFILIQFLGGCLNAQTTLTGKVLDQKTKAPIPYASVYVENTFTGKATAEDGTFSFEIKEGHQGDVIIRAMGYDTKVVKQSAFIPLGLEIYLAPISFSINEFDAIAKRALTDPDKIIRKAIKRIPENMVSDYTELEGTYHQAFQDYETDLLLDAKQAKVKVGLQGIKTDQKTDSIWHDEPLSDNVFWESFRYNDDALLPQYQIPDYGRNHLQCLLRMDPVRNHATPTFDFVERLDKDFVENHFFYLDRIGVYNGENVYQIRIYLLNEIRFSTVNPIDGKYVFRKNKMMKISDAKGFYLHHSNGTYLNRALDSKRAAVPIGRIMITTQDLAIVYFEYINGFGNDRYKFIAEYSKRNQQYYPSKLYFANKLMLNKHPDFDAKGAGVDDGLKCLMDRNYYTDIVKKYSKNKADKKRVKEIVKDNTITCYKSAYTKNFGEYYNSSNPRDLIFISSVIAKTRIVEEIQNTFQYKDYSKILHHRFLEFNTKSVDSLDRESDFYKLYYPLGDRAFHWNINLNEDRCYTSWGVDRRYKVEIPIPFTSIDENRYFKGGIVDSTYYDKKELIKGKVMILGRGDGVYREEYRKKSQYAAEP